LAFSYLTPQNIYRHYESAKQYTLELTQPFWEFERIARNRPHDGIDPAYPKTTDGTAASIVQKTPKRVVQQLPTGKIKSDQGNEWLDIVAQFIFTNKILPYANEDYGLFEKSHLMIEGGLTYGFSASYTPFLNHDGYFCPDMTIPYWGDIFIQKGKKSGYSCSYVFLRSWWQKADLEALIDSETKLSKDKDYESTWDLDALKDVLKAESAKDPQATTPHERERSAETTGIELVTGFQKGVKSKFYTFNVATRKIVRTKINKDPRGKLPIDWLYGDIDGANPLGRGIIELIGGLQNLIDSQQQMFEFNRALALAPPVIKYGNIGDFSYSPNAVIEATNPATDKVEPLVIDTTAIANYPQLYQLHQSQMFNLVAPQSTQIAAGEGAITQSKTSAGVNQQNAALSVDDNAIRKRFESWFRNWAETAVNLYFGERTGKEELQLDKETAQRLRELPDFDQSLLSPDNKILIDYDSATPVLNFHVDPNTTSVADKAQQVQDAVQILDIVMKYPMLNASFGGPIDVDVLARRLVVNSGIDDPEQVAPEPTEAQKKSKELQKQQVNPFSPMFDKPSIRIDYGDVEDPQSRAKLLELAGAPPAAPLAPMSPRVAESAAKGVAAIEPEEAGQSSQPTEAPIDLGDIYKGTTDPMVKAEIEGMAGLHPRPAHVAGEVVSNTTEHAANVLNNLGQANQVLNPPQPPAPEPVEGQPAPPPAPPAPPRHNPIDEKMREVLKRLGLSDNAIEQAIAQLDSGASPQQVLQGLGVNQ